MVVLENIFSSFSVFSYMYIVVMVYLRSLLGRCYTIHQIYKASLVSDPGISRTELTYSWKHWSLPTFFWFGDRFCLLQWVLYDSSYCFSDYFFLALTFACIHNKYLLSHHHWVLDIVLGQTGNLVLWSMLGSR